MEIVQDHEAYDCPYCHSDNISTNNFDYESMSIEEVCFNCNREWSVMYNIVGIWIPEEYEEAYLASESQVS